MPFAPMKRLSSILLSFALLSPAPSAIAQPLASPATSHDEVTLAELIAQLNALLVQLNAYLQANTTTTYVPSPTVPTTPPVSTTPPVTTPPTNTTSYGPRISVGGDSASGSFHFRVDGDSASGSFHISIYDYGIWNEVSTTGGKNVLGTSFFQEYDEFDETRTTRDFPILYNFGTATYQNDDGFHGLYKHSNGNYGKIISDVQLSLYVGYNTGSNTISSFKIGVKNPIVIEGENLGRIDGLGKYNFQNRLTSEGTFHDSTAYNAFENVFYSSGVLNGVFSDQLTSEGSPERVAGEVAIWWTDKGWGATDQEENSLVGVFFADVEE